MVWWAWDGYAWLTNEVDTERDAVRLSIFAAMAAMLIVALAIPGAFGADATVFAIAYAGVRLVHVVLYMQATGDDGGRVAVRRLLPSIAIACACCSVPRPPTARRRCCYGSRRSPRTTSGC